MDVHLNPSLALENVFGAVVSIQDPVCESANADECHCAGPSDEAYLNLFINWAFYPLPAIYPFCIPTTLQPQRRSV